MMTHSDIIELWPTIAEFASDVSVEYQAARKMHERDSISSKHWYRVIEAAKSRQYNHVTLEALANYKAKRKSKTAFENHTAA
ncbi:MAG: hypothetical protein DHS20C07_18960 [Methyloligella sp.]|nr:MAG: hypothetical protein DHS20C07_18960 [Methyloligella sp.]